MRARRLALGHQEQLVFLRQLLEQRHDARNSRTLIVFIVTLIRM
jgi:hypothetical protein